MLPLAGLGENRVIKERLHQREHALVLDPGPHPAHDERVREVVEGRLDVRIQYPAVAVGAELVDLGDRVVCSAPGAEPVGDRLEVRLEDGLEHELQRGLDDLVRQGGNPESPQFPDPPGLGILRSRTGKGVNAPAFNWARRPSRNSRAPTRSSTYR